MSASTAWQPGDVVKIILDEDRGSRKPRWVVVVGDLHHGQEGDYYLSVCITTTFPQPPLAINFPLPWHPQGRAATGLRRRSAAVLDWVRKVDPQDIVEKTGHLSAETMKALIQKLEEWEESHPETENRLHE